MKPYSNFHPPMKFFNSLKPIFQTDPFQKFVYKIYSRKHKYAPGNFPPSEQRMY